jgi:hypothetical protein
VTALDELNSDNARQVSARFFLRCGQAGRGRWRDEHTMPLFPLVLILDAEGLLAARHLVDEEAAYLHRCEALIREAAREMAA